MSKICRYTSKSKHHISFKQKKILTTFEFEFVQWSPTEPHVFSSCSADGNIAIWDVRSGKSPAASFKAHNADVNVISWNR